tara:strand:+ start:39 stop:707 length:669 start_codon:yes stop_codon:yes gene_type:complete
MENLNDTKLNRMINASYEIHYGKKKGIDMTHLLHKTIHTLEDGSGLQMILTPRHKVAKDGVIKMTEFLRDLGKNGILSHGITPQMLRTINNNVGKSYGKGMVRVKKGKGSKGMKLHRGGNIHITSMSGGDIGASVMSALVPSLIRVAPALVKSIGMLAYNKDTDKFKKDLKSIGKSGLTALGALTLKNEIGYQLNPSKSRLGGYEDSKPELMGQFLALNKNF